MFDRWNFTVCSVTKSWRPGGYWSPGGDQPQQLELRWVSPSASWSESETVRHRRADGRVRQAVEDRARTSRAGRCPRSSGRSPCSARRAHPRAPRPRPRRRRSRARAGRLRAALQGAPLDALDGFRGAPRSSTITTSARASATIAPRARNRDVSDEREPRRLSEHAPKRVDDPGMICDDQHRRVRPSRCACFHDSFPPFAPSLSILRQEGVTTA